MKDPVKSLFRVEWWLREITLLKPDRTEHMVLTRQEMMDFARAEIEKDRQFNCVFYWCRYEDGDKHNRTNDSGDPSYVAHESDQSYDEWVAAGGV